MNRALFISGDGEENVRCVPDLQASMNQDLVAPLKTWLCVFVAYKVSFRKT